jgi:hypothetical protein
MGVMTKATHAIFQARMEYSIPAVWKMAQFICEKKDRTIQIRPTKVAKTWKEAKKFSDQGDIIVIDKEQGREIIYEVKRLSANNKAADFTNELDWKQNGYMVDSCYSFDNKPAKPAVYFTVNAAMTHYGVVNVRATCESWTVRKILDREMEIEKDYLYCPINLVKFGEILL